MPGITAALASLQDVLEVKGHAISESEVWSVLCLSAEALQDVLFKGNVLTSDMPMVVVTPETVYMRPDGKITLEKMPMEAFVGSDYCAPEWRADSGRPQSDSSLEKLWIFSLGMTLYKAADYNRSPDEDLDISPQLHAVLADMCEEEADLRLTLTQIMQLSSSNAAGHMVESFSVHIMSMYELVFGSAGNMSSVGQLTNPSSVTSSPHMAHHDPLLYDIRPAPVGKSATNDDAFSKLSSLKPQASQQPGSSQRPHISPRSQPNISFTQTLEDSLKLSKLKNHHKSANISQSSNRRPFSAGSRLLQVPQRSMPALHINYQMPVAPQAQQAPLTTDSYLQHAYDKILQRRSLLAAIRHSLSNEELIDPLMYMNQQQISRIGDIQASANSLNYGAFRPAQFNQENQPDRPKSAHPVLVRDETDAVLNDPVIREAMLSSVDNQQRLQRSGTVPAIQDTLRAGSRPNRKSTTRMPIAPKANNPKQPIKGGPEFVRLAAKPVRKVKDFWPHKSSSKTASLSITIELLNGERLQLSCPSTTTGHQLFEVMLREVQLPDSFYFGLTQILGGEHLFIDPQKKVEKYIPSIKRKSPRKAVGIISFTVHQRIKFYVRSLAMVKHASTQHLLYLQLRRDVVEDRLRAEDKELINLVGVALQAEYGDYDIRRHHLNYFIVSYYFPQRLLKKMNKARQAIVNKHAVHCGLSPVEAEAKFIEDAMELHEYGIHFHGVSKAKNDPLSHTWVGVASRGLALADMRGQQRVIVQRCSWDNIAKLSFNKEKFTIKPHSHTDDPNKIHRYTDSYKKSKYLIWLSEEQHAYLIQSMSRGDYHQAAVAAGAVPAAVDDEADELYVEDVYVEDGDEELGEASSYQFQQAEPEAIRENIRDAPSDAVNALPRRHSSRRREIDEEPIVEGTAEHGLSPPDIEEALSDSLHARFDAIPSDSPEKQFTVVKLMRDPISGVGIKLAGGGSSGIFVASLVAGGAAHRDGSIQPGDRIVAINGKSTEVISQSHAMELIRKSNGVVELIVSQPVSDNVDRESSHHAYSDQGSQSSSGQQTLARSDYSNPMENEQMRAVLKAELEAEVAAIKADPQDESDAISMKYRQQLAKYHPKQRAQAQPPIQLPTPPQAISVSPPSQHQHHKSAIRRELDEISSEERTTPVDGHLASPTITNIDDINSDTDEDLVVPHVVREQTNRQTHGHTNRQTNITSLSPTATDSSEKSSQRVSAFASVNSPSRKPQPLSSNSQMKIPQRPPATVEPAANSLGSEARSTVAHSLQRSNASSPSVSSTLSEHDSDFYSSLNVSRIAGEIEQKWQQKSFGGETASGSSTVESSAPSQSVSSAAITSPGLKIAAALASRNRNKKPPVHLPSYESDDTSEEISEMLSVQNNRIEIKEQPLSASVSTLEESSYNESTLTKAKLKTPINDNLNVGDNYELSLEKVNQSLGMNVTGGVNTSVKHGGIYVKSLVPHGAADMSAKIRIGDRVISVNSIRLTSVTHKQAVETLRNASAPVTLVMERCAPPPTPQALSRGATSSAEFTSPVRDEEDTPVNSFTQDSATPDIEKLSVIRYGECAEVTLTKGKTGLGFSVLGGKDPASTDPRLSLIRVKRVFPLGSAAKSEQLRVGDIVLRVNDKSVEGLTHKETVQMLRTAPSTVKLFICRPDPLMLSPLPDTSPDLARGTTNHSRESTLTKSQTSTLGKSSLDTPQGSHKSQSPATTIDRSPSAESTVSRTTESNDQTSSLTTKAVNQPQTLAGMSAPQTVQMKQVEREVDLNETRSTISATSYGTQDSSTSRDTVQTVLKSTSVQEFEATLRTRRGIDYNLPTPIRELDDMLQANTSTHTSRSHSPLTLSRGSSLTRNDRLLPTDADITKISDRLADLEVSQELGSDEEVTDSSSSDEDTIDSSSTLSEPVQVEPPPPPPNVASATDTQAIAVEPRRALFSMSSVSRSSSSAVSAVSESSERMVTATLQKDNYGSLGFSVAGAASLGGCYIKKIIKDPAMSEGTLRAGDRLLQVNGHDMTRLSNPAAVALIKNQPMLVTITVLRPVSADDVPSKPPRTGQETPSIRESVQVTGQPESVEPTRSYLPSAIEPVAQRELAESNLPLAEAVEELEPESVNNGEERISTLDVAAVISIDDTDEAEQSAKSDVTLKEDSQTEMLDAETAIADAQALVNQISDEDFSSVEGDVPDNIEDVWTSDSEGGEEPQLEKGVVPDSHIGTPSQSDLNSTLERTLDDIDPMEQSAEEVQFLESRISTPSQESSSEESDDSDADQSAVDRPKSQTSLKDSASSWGDSLGTSDLEERVVSDGQMSPIDLTRMDSQRSATDGASSSPLGGLSRNASTHLSRHDSTHSNQSFLSTPILSRNTSLKLPPTEEVYRVVLTKHNETVSLGFSVLGILAGGQLFVCVKAIKRGGLAHVDGRIKVGDKILQVNGEEIEGDTELEVQEKCAHMLRQCQGQVELDISRDKADSLSEDLVLTHDEDDQLLYSDDQLGALSDGPYERRRLTGQSAPKRIFGPSVTTTDEDSDYDEIAAEGELSAAIDHIGADANRPGTAGSEESAEDSITDDSSFDFDLPDESHFLESSIRLTRRDMKSPLSDDTKCNSESDTDHVMSEDEGPVNSTRLTTDAHTDDTDAEGSMREGDLTGGWSTGRTTPPSSRYDSSAIPGATVDPDWMQELNKEKATPRYFSLPGASTVTDDINSLPKARFKSKSADAKVPFAPHLAKELQANVEQTNASARSSFSVPPNVGQTTPTYTPPGNRKLSVTSMLSDKQTEAGSVQSLKKDQSNGTDSLNGPFAQEVTMAWVKGLQLISTPARGLYTDSSLEGVISSLLAKIATDDTSEEFRQLKAAKQVHSCDAGKERLNKPKNRFRNVLPYDATRVKLHNVEDYINASHIQRQMGKDTCYHYIASQGPLPYTTNDFWEMVLEQGVTIIAMVTQDVENGKVKCHRYWPDSLNTPMEFDDSYSVTLTKVFELEDFDVRHLEVEDTELNIKKKVIHMNYTGWPDHGMPASARPLLQFIRLVHELHSGGPLLVHCSAGIGRTGTLLTLDIVLGCIEKDLKFDINEIVTDLRKQRPGMIQTKDQYLFCYTAILEALEELRKQTALQNRLHTLKHLPDGTPVGELGKVILPDGTPVGELGKVILPDVQITQEDFTPLVTNGSRIDQSVSATNQSALLDQISSKLLISQGPSEDGSQTEVKVSADSIMAVSKKDGSQQQTDSSPVQPPKAALKTSAAMFDKPSVILEGDSDASLPPAVPQSFNVKSNESYESDEHIKAFGLDASSTTMYHQSAQNISSVQENQRQTDSSFHDKASSDSLQLASNIIPSHLPPTAEQQPGVARNNDQSALSLKEKQQRANLTSRVANKPIPVTTAAMFDKPSVILEGDSDASLPPAVPQSFNVKSNESYESDEHIKAFGLDASSTTMYHQSAQNISSVQENQLQTDSSFHDKTSSDSLQLASNMAPGDLPPTAEPDSNTVNGTNYARNSVNQSQTEQSTSLLANQSAAVYQSSVDQSRRLNKGSLNQSASEAQVPTDYSQVYHSATDNSNILYKTPLGQSLASARQSSNLLGNPSTDAIVDRIVENPKELGYISISDKFVSLDDSDPSRSSEELKSVHTFSNTLTSLTNTTGGNSTQEMHEDTEND